MAELIRQWRRNVHLRYMVAKLRSVVLKCSPQVHSGKIEEPVALECPPTVHVGKVDDFGLFYRSTVKSARWARQPAECFGKETPEHRQFFFHFFFGLLINFPAQMKASSTARKRSRAQTVLVT